MSLLQDTRYALRTLRQSWAFTIVAVGSLAFGIGANTAIFTLINTVLLKWLPVSSPQELAVLARNPLKPETYHNYPDYEFVRDQSASYSGVIATSGSGPKSLTIGKNTQLAGVSLVSGNYFDVLGVRPAAGRLLNPADNAKEGASPYVVLSYPFWQRAFGGESRAVGETVRINGSPFSVVGVAREGFAGTEVGSAPDVYAPIMMYREVNRGYHEWNTRHMWWLTLIGRRKPGVSVEQATAELTLLWDRIEKNDPETKKTPEWAKGKPETKLPTLLPGGAGYSGLRNRISQPLLVLMAVVGGVLLIACANVANLLLARATAREREIAIRLAVGASRGRLIAQMLTESVILSLAGGLGGVLFAWPSTRLLVSLMPRRTFDIALDLSPDWRVLGFAVGISILTGILFGLAPAIKATRPNLTPSLKGDAAPVTSGFARLDLRKILMAAQVAISLVLLIGTSLFVRSLDRLRELDPGFRRERVLMVRTDPIGVGYKDRQIRDYYERLQRAAQTLPEVASASLANVTPLGGMRWNNRVEIQGYQWKPGERPIIDMNSVGPRYFETIGIPILLGRDFTERDEGGVAIVNQAMARRFWPDGNAIGRRISRGDVFKMEDSLEIVGVVGDARYFGLRKDPEMMTYIPSWGQKAGDWKTLCVRTAGEPKRMVEALRRKAQELDAGVPVMEVRTIEEQIDDNLLQERLVTILSSFFGVLALLLASVGLYGVVAYAVTRRTREIGIRMALGAERPRVLWMVLRFALTMVAVGAAVGVPIALALTRLVSSFLYGIDARDPAIIAIACSVLFAVTLAASYIPARRACRIDPMVALRYE